MHWQKVRKYKARPSARH